MKNSHSPITDTLTLQAPAKINLCLEVLGRRTDGYHNIFSLMQAVSIYDEIVLMPKTDDITVKVEGADLPTGQENLVYRAAQLVLSRSPENIGVHILLRKNIPVGAGLGGGSSDAATAMTGLNRLFNLGFSDPELMELGSGLGADIPFFLSGGPALAEGIGERLTPLPKWKYYLLLVYPRIHISTGWAYENLNFQLTKKTDYNKIHPLCYQKKDMDLLCQGLKNDFEPSVIREYPVIQKIKGGLIQCGALGSLMTGSGACVFGLFAKKSDSILCRKKIVDLIGSEFWIAEAETV
jgi:4-diphosphocytidyl-2-C-methyl-D-erythritol kinase